MRGAAVGGVALVALLLAGCSEPDLTSSPTTTAAADAGYQSSDGTVRIWAPDARPGPVTLRGTAYDGTAIDVTGWRGDVVVVNLWFAACPPCRAEAADLVALANGKATAGVHVVGLDNVDSPANAEAYVRQFSVPYPTIDDRQATAVAALSGIVPLNSTPSTIVVGRDGRVYGRIVGMVDASTLGAMVDAALAEGGSGASAAPGSTTPGPTTPGPTTPGRTP